MINARIKSAFIFPAVAVGAILLVLSVIAALAGDADATAWVGAAIASLALPAGVFYLMFTRAPRTSENLPFLLLLPAIGIVVATWEQFIEGVSGWPPTLTAFSGGTLMLLYVFWYSRFGRRDSALLSVGSPLPRFALRTANGDTFDSEQLAGAPAILLFYRGNWCPLCMAQVREIAERYHEINALGAKVLLISPQADEHSSQLAARYDVPFHFLVDTENKLAESLGIAIGHGVPVGMRGGYEPDTVLPTVVVSNSRGTIVFSDQTDNYRVRPEPDVFLAILRRSQVAPS